MQSKTSSLQDFEIVARLGEGAFGQVFKIKRRADDQIYALKKVKLGSMKQKERDNALNQIRILASYQGENIIGYKQAFFDDNQKLLCIVMEFASGGDILKRVQTCQKKRTQIPESEIWKALVHMTQGLKELHDRKVLHRDLKCANVFVTSEGVYKLGDLNVSKVLKMDMAYTQTGTPYYASPEIWKDKPYGTKSDMWSLGCILYEMAALRPPFTAVDLQGLYRKIVAGHFQRIPMNYSNQLENVIRSLLRQNPKERPSVEELLSSKTVKQHYQGTINFVSKKSESNDLLKTIIYDPRNIKGLGAKLPKAKYDVSPIIEQDFQQDKLRQFMEKKRKQEQENMKKQEIKDLSAERDELHKKRERVLSACGVRKNPICDSPAKEVKKTPVLESSKKNQLPKLPPRPNVPQGQNYAYKLPPKPTNNSRPLNSSRDRSRSKENLRNAGQKILGGGVRNPSEERSERPQRCNSAKKIVYPNWW